MSTSTADVGTVQNALPPCQPSDGPIALKKVSIQSKVTGLVAEVSVTNTFVNTDDGPVSNLFKFLFPSHLGTVFAFEALIDGKPIVGDLEDSAKIQSIFFRNKADEKQFLENSCEGEVLCCAIENMEPKKPLTISFKYITEITSDGNIIRFAFPTSFTPMEWTEEEEEEEEQATPFHLQVAVDIKTLGDIQEIESPTHAIEDFDFEGTTGKVRFADTGAVLAGDFVLLITLTQPLTSNFCLKRDESQQLASLFSICPIYFATERSKISEYIFLIDCSNSMIGSHIQYARSGAQFLLSKVPFGSNFNIISFGDNYNKLFMKSEPVNEQNVLKGFDFIKQLSAELGTKKDLLRPLLDAYSSNLSVHIPARKTFVFTDGQIDNQKQVLQVIHKHAPESRIFGLGIGNRALHSSVYELSKAGAGLCEFVAGDEDLEKKLLRLFRCSCQPHLELQVELRGTQFLHHVPQKKLKVEGYCNVPFSLYGFLSSFTTGELVVKTSAGFPITSLPFKNEEGEKQGVTSKLHCLVSKYVMREIGNSKDEIIKLSQQHHISSKHTAFFKQKGEISLFSVFIPGEEIIGQDGTARKGESKRVYDPEFLRKYQQLFKEPPEGIPQIEIVVGFQKNQKGRGRNRNQRGKVQKQKTVAPVTTQPVAPLISSSNRWKRPAKKGGDDAQREEIFGKVRGVLNKITLDTFGNLSKKLASIELKTLETLKGVARIVFEKAILEQKYSIMYAELCLELSKSSPVFHVNGQKQTFRCILLNCCQEEFEKKVQVERKEGMTDADYEEMLLKVRKKALGNVRFVGELYKLCMLTDTIMHESLNHLLSMGDEASFEGLSQLLTTIGKNLEEKKKNSLDGYFQKIDTLANDKKLPSRIRFMFKDLIDLRKNNWVPRRKENDPKTIADLHKEAEEEDAMNEAASRQILSNPRKVSVDFGQKKSKSFSNESSTPQRDSTTRMPTNDQGWKSSSMSDVPQEKKILTKQQPKAAPPPKGKSEESETKASSHVETPKVVEEKKPSVVEKKLSEEELQERIDSLLEEYLQSEEIEEAGLCVKELNSPSSHSQVVYKGLCFAIEKKDKEVNLMMKLFTYLFQEKILQDVDFLKGFESILEQLEDFEIDIPYAPQFVCKFLANGLLDGFLGMSFLQHAFDHLRSGDNQKPIKLVLDTLSYGLEKNKETFKQKYQSSPLDLLHLLPEKGQGLEGLKQFLTGKSDLTVLLTSS